MQELNHHPKGEIETELYQSSSDLDQEVPVQGVFPLENESQSR